MQILVNDFSRIIAGNFSDRFDPYSPLVDVGAGEEEALDFATRPRISDEDLQLVVCSAACAVGIRKFVAYHAFDFIEVYAASEDLRKRFLRPTM